MIMNGIDWESFLLYLGTSLVLYVPAVIIYRLYFHPLAKFPGPRLAAITRYYEAYYDVVQKGQYTFKIAELHKEYGPIIRISPSELHVNDPSFYEKLFRHDGRWDKYAWMVDAFGVPNAMVTTAEHDLHKLRRGPMNAFFSKATVARKQDIIQTRVSKLHGRLDEFVDSGAVLNIGPAISAMTTDVATEYILGKSYDNLSRRDFNESMATIFQSAGDIWRTTKHVRVFGPLMRAVPLSILGKLNDPGIKAFVEYLKTCEKATAEIKAAHGSETLENSEDKTPRTLLHEILDSQNLAPSEKNSSRLCNELQTVLGAGFETVALVLRFIVFYLYSDVSKLNRLRAELHELSSDGEVSFTELERLPYLTAVILEGLRMRPGLASRSQRIAPDRALSYGEWVIPPGTPVGMTAFLMHHNEQVYRDAYKFKPERWLDKEWRRKTEKFFAPFSRGTRMCLGMQLAWAELYLALYMVVTSFDFEFVDTGPEEVECNSDRFLIGTRSQKGVRAFVTRYQK